MYLLMEEQMRSMSEQAMSWHVTNEDVQRIVEQVVKTRLRIANMKKQASDDDLQRVEKMEQGLKVFMEDVRTRQKEVEAMETEEQNATMGLEDEAGRKATREDRGCAGLVQGVMRGTRFARLVAKARPNGTEEKENMQAKEENSEAKEP